MLTWCFKRPLDLLNRNLTLNIFSDPPLWMTSGHLWTQITLNELNEKWIQFSSHSIVLIKTINLSYCWARLDKNRESYATLKNDAFCVSVRKSDIFQFSEKLLNFFVQILDSSVEKFEKNYGEKIFDLSVTVLLRILNLSFEGR